MINITRRQFLQYCTASAAALGLSQMDLLKLEKALATPQTGCNTPGIQVVFMTGQACSGCQTSLLNRVVDVTGGYYDNDLLTALGVGVAQGTPSDPLGLDLNVVNDVADLLVGDAVRALTGIPRNIPWADDLPGVGLLPTPTNAFPNGFVTLDWLTTVQAGAGDINVAHLNSIVTGGPFVLLLDGAIPTVDEKFCFVFDNNPVNASGPAIISSLPTGSTTLSAALRWMLNSGNCLAAVCVGTCSSWGGVPAGKRNKTGAMDLINWVTNFEGPGSIPSPPPIVRVPGCPPHPDWVVYPIAHALINGVASLLAPGFLTPDGRPAGTFPPRQSSGGHCVDCPNGTGTGPAGPEGQAEQLGDSGCMLGLGCKGPFTGADCPTRGKNTMDDGTKANWCVGKGKFGTRIIGDARYVCHGCVEPLFPDYDDGFFGPA